MWIGDEHDAKEKGKRKKKIVRNTERRIRRKIVPPRDRIDRWSRRSTNTNSVLLIVVPPRQQHQYNTECKHKSGRKKYRLLRPAVFILRPQPNHPVFRIFPSSSTSTAAGGASCFSRYSTATTALQTVLLLYCCTVLYSRTDYEYYSKPRLPDVTSCPP